MDTLYANTEIKRGVEEALPSDLATAVSNVLQGVAQEFRGKLGDWEKTEKQRKDTHSITEKRTYSIPDGRIYTEVTLESRGQRESLETRASATVNYIASTRTEEARIESTVKRVLKQYNFKVQNPHTNEEGVQI